ncbi:membrane protein insertase YidC, partial [Aliarcobacter butzleri]
MNNLNQNNGMQKRMIIMTIVVFVFFIAYEFLVLKPQQEAKMAQAKIEQEQKQNSAPEVSTSQVVAENSVNTP